MSKQSKKIAIFHLKNKIKYAIIKAHTCGKAKIADIPAKKDNKAELA